MHVFSMLFLIYFSFVQKKYVGEHYCCGAKKQQYLLCVFLCTCLVSSKNQKIGLVCF